MNVTPAFDSFRSTHDAGTAQVVSTTLVADLETPVSAMLKLAAGVPYSFLLESVEGGNNRGRYSFLGMRPDLIWRCHRGGSELNRKAEADLTAFEPCEAPALQVLRQLLDESRIDLPETLAPMAAGLFGYLAYDMVRHAERIPDENPDTIGAPDSIMMRPTIVAVFDNVEDNITIVTPVRPVAGVSAEHAYEAAQDRLADIVERLNAPLSLKRDVAVSGTKLPEPISNTGKARYMEIVEQCKEYIRAGDAFQVVPSHRLTVPFELPPFLFYRALRRLNPSPFLFHLDFGDFAVVGSSPEILVRVRDGEVTIRPLAGTRRRGANPAEDKALAEDLLNDPKELAEHLMLLDLGRNDVGRVAKIGSVKPTEQFIIEYYSHVMHITSNVIGELDEKYDAIDALFAGFPAGTVSGAPKVRAMEIIEELEVARRGVYSGCVGYFGAGGAMDTCIALRTAVIKDGVLNIQAGAGIVADSVPESEWDETVNKAMALVRAAEEAVRLAGTDTGNTAAARETVAAAD